MRTGGHIALVLPLLLVILVSSRAASLDDDLTPQERRGKDIYFGLTGPSSAITARVGNPPIELTSSMIACANCHGSDGRGKPEGGVVPPDITWEALTKPYGVTRPDGRTHPPYTERLLVRAIGLGLDPAGNELQAVMPRFQMTHGDAAALTSYLKRLSTDHPSGIADEVIRIGTIVPATGPLADAGRAAASALTAYFDTLNAQGGLYGRKIDLRVASLDGTDTRVEAFLRESAPFAMVGGLLPDAGAETIARTEAHDIPYVGPLTPFPNPSSVSPTSRHTFYLLSGAEQQACALLDFQRSSAGVSAPSVFIVHAAAVVPGDVVDRIGAHAEQRGWRVASVSLDRATASEMANGVKRSGATHTLLLVDGPRALAIARELAAIDWTPAMLVPGSLATNDLLNLPAPLLDRTFIALPSVPSDQTQAALQEYRALAAQHHLPSTDVAWQLAAIGSAKVLAQGLMRAGRGVTRATLVSSLEALTDFDTGLMPRIRFGRGRRLGASGAYIVALDPALKSFKPVTGWLPVADPMN
jgi:ABC-type branched-subunit amino acid transport system substrate-binding protein